MVALDFFTRLIFMPMIFLFILSFIPEAIKDVKEWRKLLVQEGSRVKKSKKKTVQVYTAATVYLNSPSLTKKPKYSPKMILSHK